VSTPGGASPGEHRRGWLSSLAASAWGRQTAWALTDQVLSSLGNLVLGLLVAGSVSRRDFGAFGITFAVYVLAICAARALGSTVLQVRFSASPSVERNQAFRDSLGVPLLLSIAIAPLLLVAATAAKGPTGAGLLLLAVGLPGLLLQDSIRLGLIAFRRARSATLNDLLWLVVELGPLAYLRITANLTLSGGLVAWEAGAYAAAVFGLLQVGGLPALPGGVAWLRRHRDFGLFTLAEFLLMTGTPPLTLLAVGQVGGLADVATLRAADLIVNPLNLLLTGVLVVGLPEVSRLWRREPDRVPGVLARAGAAFAAAGVVFGVAMAMLPTPVGRALVGANWPSARSLIPILGLNFAAVGVYTAFLTGLRVLEAVRAALVLRLVLSPLYLVAGVTGIVLGGPVACVAASSAVTVCGAWLTKRVFASTFGAARAATLGDTGTQSPRART
jgi:O-antigen/teichoic acid export membrane protein